MKRTLAISDIHGEIELLEELLVKVKYDPTSDQLILLGDYVDRGPNAKAVLEKVMSLHEKGAILLRGNHEDMMIKAMTSEDERPWKHWVERNGGDKTLHSYGYSAEALKVDEGDAFQKPIISSELLDKHVSFIQSLNPLVIYDQKIFVHAGVHPETPIEETDLSIHLWIRDEFHQAYKGEETVIFGHTPTRRLHKDEDNHSVYFGDNRIIGIDGGAVYGGQLNCLILPDMTVVSVPSKTLLTK